MKQFMEKIENTAVKAVIFFEKIGFSRNKKEEVVSEGELLEQQFKFAVQELELAQQQFDNACGDCYIDIANEQLSIAQKKVDLISTKLKLLRGGSFQKF